MNIKTLLAVTLLTFMPFTYINAASLSDDNPDAEPKMTIITKEGEEKLTEYTGSAPISAAFTANVKNLGPYTPHYEWQVFKSSDSKTPYLVRYDADFEYEFRETGTHTISLQISFINGNDTIPYKMPTDFTVTAYSSVLNVPNAFSPNGDGTNDDFGVKDDYKSIIEFKGYIFNRHGLKLFEFKNITDRWDGTYKGHDVPDGAYYVNIEAKGADGRRFHIKKAVNILRGYSSTSGGATY